MFKEFKEVWGGSEWNSGSERGGSDGGVVNRWGREGIGDSEERER